MCLLQQMFCVSWIRHCIANQTSLSCREMYSVLFKWSRVQIFSWIWDISAHSDLHIPQPTRQFTGHCIQLGQDCFLPNIGYLGEDGVGKNKIYHGCQELTRLYSASYTTHVFLIFLSLDYPNNCFENISIFYLPLFNSVTTKKLLGRKNSVRAFAPLLFTSKVKSMIPHILQVIIG